MNLTVAGVKTEEGKQQQQQELPEKITRTILIYLGSSNASRKCAANYYVK